MKRLIYFMSLAATIAMSGQTFEEEFRNSQRSQESAYQKFQQRNDSLFAQFIRDSWREMVLLPVQMPLADPKPDTLSPYEQELKEKVYQETPVDTAVIMRSFHPEPLEALDYFPEIKIVEANFYGLQIKVRFPVDLSNIEIRGQNEEALYHYWLDASKAGYEVLIEDITELATRHKLPDFGGYLLVEASLEKVNISSEQKVFLTWFLLNKMGLACKLGFSDGVPVLLMGTHGKIYGKPYFRQGDFIFYAINKEVGKLHTYGNPTEIKLRAFDLRISSPIDLPLKPVDREVVFQALGENHRISLFYNRHVADLLHSFPQCDIRYALDSKSTRLTQKSIETSLGPILNGKDLKDQVTILMAFVQSFGYQKDQEQFGREKVMYPDEFLSFPYSDCDDRVVFLSYLLAELTNVKQLAVIFPRHIALAVRVSPQVYGEAVLYKGHKYVFCDPTYLNAPLGAVIGQADRDRMRLLPID